jgi:ABC-type sugar transport system permease subunit
MLVDDPVAQRALVNNNLWTFGSATITTAIGLGLAVWLDSRRLFARNLFRAAFFVPSVLPLVAVGLVWGWLYNPEFGAINEVLRAIGLGSLARGWLGSYDTAFPATFIASTWVGIGFPMVVYLAALQSLSRELYEAAQIDGASGWQQFWRLTLPLLGDTHIVVLTLAVINSFRVFDLIYSLTYGGPAQSTQVLGTWMYFQTFQYGNVGYGAAIAWAIAAITITVSIPYLRHTLRGVR